MNYDSVENLSEEKIIELYENVIGHNEILSGVKLYVCCDNGATGYWYDNGKTNNSNYIHYCGPDCTYRRYSTCATNCSTARDVCGSYSAVALEMTNDLESEHKPNCFN